MNNRVLQVNKYNRELMYEEMNYLTKDFPCKDKEGHLLKDRFNKYCDEDDGTVHYNIYIECIHCGWYSTTRASNFIPIDEVIKDLKSKPTSPLTADNVIILAKGSKD
jgi:hypothetical protein